MKQLLKKARCWAPPSGGVAFHPASLRRTEKVRLVPRISRALPLALFAKLEKPI
jgi:hypothetical protein